MVDTDHRVIKGDDMKKTRERVPELVVEYVDPIEGFRGWLAIDCFDHELCAGGLRVQKGLTRECVENLASTMTLKMRIAGIRADGAKSGIDYDPLSPGKEAALSRFIRAIRPFIAERYSIGPDMNTTMGELDKIVNSLGLPSIKAAVANAQGLDHEDFLKRIATLTQPVGHTELGRLRAGSGLAAACLGTIDYLNIPYYDATVAIQGFGGLASGAVYTLNKAGVKIVGIADKDKCLLSHNNHSLDIDRLLKQSANGLIADKDVIGRCGAPCDISEVECDIFIPAAIEEAITAQEARKIQVKAVICGANLGVTREAEQILHERGILVIPDMVAGCGGSLSMEGLFGPESPPSVYDVIGFVDEKMRSIVKRVLERSKRDGVPQREAALRLCAETKSYPGTKPYGTSNRKNGKTCSASKNLYSDGINQSMIPCGGVVDSGARLHSARQNDE